MTGLNKYSVIFFILSFLYEIPAQTNNHKNAEDIFSMNSNDKTISLQKNIYIFKDKTRNLSIKDVLDKKIQNKFKKNVSGISNYGYSNEVYWLRIKISSNILTEKKWFIHFKYPHIDYLDFYQIDPYGNVKTIKTGDMRIFRTKEIRHRNFVFHFDPQYKKVTTIYFRLESSGALTFPLELIPCDSFLSNNRREEIVYGFYYGMIVILVLYNLALFFTFRDQNYIYYILHITSFIAYHFVMAGYSFEYLFYDQPALNNLIQPASIGFAVIFTALFTQSFLKTKSKIPIMHYALNGIHIASIFYILSVLFLPGNVINIYSAFLPILMIVLIVLTAIILSIRKTREAYFFLTAWLLLFMGTSFLALHRIGILPDGFLVNYGIVIGSTIQVFVLSLGLSDRINQLRHQLINHEQIARQAQNELIEHLNKDEEQRNEFLSKTASDILVPLENALETLASIRSEHQSCEEKNTLIDKVVFSTEKIRNIISNVIDFTQLKESRRNLRQKPVDFYTLSTIITNRLKNQLNLDNVFIHNQISPGIPYVLGDEYRIQQILIHLINNSIKFTQKGEVNLYSETKGQMLEIIISDTGIGIPEDKLEKIFEPFEKGEKGIRYQEGTGLGLTLVKNLIDGMGGSIYIFSREGEGTRVHFTLPVTDKAKNNEIMNNASVNEIDNRISLPSEIITLDSSGNVPENTYSDKPISILIVDDDPVNLHLLSNFLNIHQFHILKAETGEAALDILADSRPDLILLDIIMPGLNGYQVCRKIREKWSLFELPVIMITAKSESSDMVIGFEAGANDYLVKPFDKTELLARVKTHIKTKELIIENKNLAALREELDIAKRIQLATLPKALPKSPFYQVHTHYLPMTMIGGDYYHFFPISDRKLGVFIADVSGHGIPAALISSMVNIVFQSLKSLAEKPVDLLKNMNDILMGQMEEQFLTASYTFIDLEKKKLYAARCGHEPTLLLNSSTEKIEKIQPKGKAIGLVFDNPIQIQTHNISYQDKIILYTDGIPECMNERSELYSDQRMYEVIEKNSKNSGSDIIDDIHKSLSEWKGKPRFDDDITLVVIDILE